MVFAVWVVFEIVIVPDVVTGDPETENSDGAASAILVTVPLPALTQLTFVPSVVSTLPLLLDCEGNKLLIAFVWEVAPVPPLVMASVPPSVIVPDDVIGPPDVVSPVVPPSTSTEVTVPVP